MMYFISYDIANPKRLVKVAKTLERDHRSVVNANGPYRQAFPEHLLGARNCAEC